MPVHGKGVPEPRGLQLWVDLPKQVRPFMLLCAHIINERVTVQDGGRHIRVLITATSIIIFEIGTILSRTRP